MRLTTLLKTTLNFDRESHFFFLNRMAIARTEHLQISVIHQCMLSDMLKSLRHAQKLLIIFSDDVIFCNNTTNVFMHFEVKS